MHDSPVTAGLQKPFTTSLLIPLYFLLAHKPLYTICAVLLLGLLHWSSWEQSWRQIPAVFPFTIHSEVHQLHMDPANCCVKSEQLLCFFWGGLSARTQLLINMYSTSGLHVSFYTSQLCAPVDFGILDWKAGRYGTRFPSNTPTSIGQKQVWWMRKISHLWYNSSHVAPVSQASGQNWLSSFCWELMGRDNTQQGDLFHPERCRTGTEWIILCRCLLFSLLTDYFVIPSWVNAADSG